MNVFYSTDIVGDKIKLKGQEAQHCAKVLRKAKGSTVYVVDGIGHQYQCEIVDVGRQEVDLLILSQKHSQQDPDIPHLGFGIIKNTTRLEWMLEKITEIGVGRITPLLCERSERMAIKRTRLEKVLVSAMKQSLNLHLPVLDDPMPIETYINEQGRTNLYIASYGPDVRQLSAVEGRSVSPVILIGPEGDFTNAEVMQAESAGYQRVNLGQTRLRAETAAVVGCTLLRN